MSLLKLVVCVFKKSFFYCCENNPVSKEKDFHYAFKRPLVKMTNACQCTWLILDSEKSETCFILDTFKSEVLKVDEIQECYAWCMFSDFTIVLCRCGLITALATQTSMSQYLLKGSRKTKIVKELQSSECSLDKNAVLKRN